MRNNYTSNDTGIFILKLTNGTTLISELKNKDGEFVTLISPLEMIKSFTEPGFTDVELFPWLFGANNHTVDFHTVDIIAMSKASSGTCQVYHEMVVKHGIESDNNIKQYPGLDNPENFWKNRMN